jgi:hypothetical protein
MFPILLVSTVLLTAVFLLTRGISSLTIPRYRIDLWSITDDSGYLPVHLGDMQTEDIDEQKEERVTALDPDDIDFPPHLGDRSGEELLKPEIAEITAQFLISYPKRVYFNQLFWMRVEIGIKGVTSPAPAERKVTTRGLLRFTHRWFPEMFEDSEAMPRPEIRVELKFTEDEFRCANKVQVKSLPENKNVVYDFAVKSLMSEDSVLAVEISYVGSVWKPRKVTEIKITKNHLDESTTETLTPAGIVEDIDVLVREDLTIETKSFLNMNAASVSILSKAIAAVLTAIYIGLVIGFGLTDDIPTTLVVGISSLLSALGIPLATDLWKDAQAKREKTIVA